MRSVRRSREQIEELLAGTKLAGADLAHSRANNVAHVYRLVAGDGGVTLGIDLIHDRLARAPVDPRWVLETIASITGCSRDITLEEGQGYIKPSATYEGLRAAAVAIRGALDRRASFLFASGHPRNMAPAYEALAAYVRARGCEVVTVSPEGIPEYDGLKLELWGSVYIVTRDGEPAHTHGHLHGRALLERTPPVGIAIADHGFAGAALNRGISAVCVMDTNDPGVAVASALGAPVTVVPLNDNSPGEVVHEITGIIIEFIEDAEGAGG